MFTKDKIAELEKTLKSAQNFLTSIWVEQDEIIRVAQITSDQGCKFVRSYLFESPGSLAGKHTGHDTLAEAFSELKNLLSTANILPETVTVVSDRENLVNAARSAWCKGFGREDLDGKFEIGESNRCEQIFRANLWKKITGGPAGIERWNNVPMAGRTLLQWHNSDLTGSKLKHANFSLLDLQNSKFDGADLEGATLSTATISNASFCGANLTKAQLVNAKAAGANFTDAVLKNASLRNGDLQNAIFHNADLKKCDFLQSNIRGVDLSTAKLDGAKFSAAQYDEKTVLPPDFPHWSSLIWRGKGPDPYREFVKQKLNTLKVQTFEDMLAQVKAHFDAARLDNVLKMLKKERFQLLSIIDLNNSVMGVVKSQTDPDLIYACSLNSKGEYSCSTQNLRPCGGLKGALCKHILVLVIGLARAKEIDLTDATKWILTSTDNEPTHNKGAMKEIVLKYQAAMTGEFDWRPTETIPEDYYIV